MALYLFSEKYVSRGQGRCAQSASAYRSGDKLHHNGRTYDYTKRRDIIHAEIMLPEYAPLKFYDRQTLCDEVEKAEDNSTRRKTARTFREIILALQREFTFETSLSLVSDLVSNCFVQHGMCADFAIHRGDSKDEDRIEGNHLKVLPHNPHAHVLLTTRYVGPGGFSEIKAREWDDWGKTDLLMQWREYWETTQNIMFERKGLDARVSHKSYKARGIDRLPTKHCGPAVMAMERRGIKTYIGEINRDIEEKNRNLEIQREHQHQLDIEQEIDLEISR